MQNVTKYFASIFIVLFNKKMFSFSFFVCFVRSKYISMDIGSFNTKVFDVPLNKEASISLNLHGKRMTNTYIGFRADKSFNASSNERISENEGNLLTTVIGEKAVDYSETRPWLTTGFLPLFIDATENRKKELAKRFDINYSAARIDVSDLLPMYMQLISREYSPLEEIEGVLVAVPATFTIPQRKIIEDALQIAGLRCDGVIDDATAVAYNYAIDRTKKFLGQEKKILFVDVGATSIKAYVYNFKLSSESSSPEITRLSYAINTEIGGFEVTKAIRKHIISTNKLKNLTDAEIKRIDNTAEHLKKKLSIARKGTEICDNIQGRDITVKLDRATIEKFIRPLADEVMNTISEAVGNMKIDDIEVIGGSSRIPLIANSIKELQDDILRHSLNSDEAIAQGLAYYQQFIHGISIYRPITTRNNYSSLSIAMKSDDDLYPFCQKSGSCIQFVEFQCAFNTLEFMYTDPEIVDNLEHVSFNYRVNMSDDETNVSIQFTDAPFDIEFLTVCRENSGCTPVDFFIGGEYHNASRDYHIVMGKYELERHLSILKHDLDQLSSRALREIKFNTTLKMFTNETQRHEVERKAKKAIKWLKDNAEETKIENWKQQIYELREVVDPIYFRMQENTTYFKYMEELARLLEYAIQYSRFEVPINRSFVGQRNIERLQGAVDKANEWMKNAINQTYSRPPWEDREVTSRDILQVYKDLSAELDRIVKMKPYVPKGEKKVKKEEGIFSKAINWMKDKMDSASSTPAAVHEDVIEDNQL